MCLKWKVTDWDKVNSVLIISVRLSSEQQCYIRKGWIRGEQLPVSAASQQQRACWCHSWCEMTPCSICTTDFPTPSNLFYKFAFTPTVSPPREGTMTRLWVISVRARLCVIVHVCGMNESGTLFLHPPPLMSWRPFRRKHHQASRDILRDTTHCRSACTCVSASVWLIGNTSVDGRREGLNRLWGIIAEREQEGKAEWPCRTFAQLPTEDGHIGSRTRTRGPLYQVRDYNQQRGKQRNL